MIIAGLLNKRVTLYKRTMTAPDTGNGPEYTLNQAGKFWAEFVRDGYSQNVIIGDGEAGIITRDVRMRSGCGAAKGWRLAWNGHTYEVVHVNDTNPGELVLQVKELEL